MIAQLPMYLRSGNLDAHIALWELIRDELRSAGLSAPDALDLTTEYDEVWSDRDLCLSQVCNLPLRDTLKDKLTLIGACDYGLEGCEPGYYRSLFVVREDHRAEAPEALDGLTMAYNDAQSHSGWGAAWFWASRRGLWFNPALRTGAHHGSLMAVVNGDVDFAVIDAQSFREFLIDTPEARQVHVIGATETSPGQTFCTRAGVEPRPYFEAISSAIDALPAAHRSRLGLRGIVALPREAYDLPVPPHPTEWHRAAVKSCTA
ncbi:phosphate/phosphite/phosphonate ABC transporter substrate-binding protein [Celeribacter litoreus]|uniref:phosphate/phosphite/phosphonate ABC transporter substrate-binding protein n=1 Tax=Celeribacter litoreus TaxID=2876714 RepID=UPI001CCB2E67|nr:PhnD/SsuA/transferrin family substrate-binding protein [Celeribacter litoreus]MCA0045178.1 phosphate/phosphite/phosphonate ABC transporter substrate-binding protein [Celeribacter litoreus]